MDLLPFITMAQKNNQKVIATFDQALWREGFAAEQARLTKRGMRLKAENGGLPGCAPVGYLNKRVGVRAWVEIDPVKGPLVKEAFELAAAGEYSLKQLLRIMTDKGLTSRNGREMSVSGFRWMLQNPFYKGMVRYGDMLIPGIHIALVEVVDDNQ